MVGNYELLCYYPEYAFILYYVLFISITLCTMLSIKSFCIYGGDRLFAWCCVGLYSMHFIKIHRDCVSIVMECIAYAPSIFHCVSTAIFYAGYPGTID